MKPSQHTTNYEEVVSTEDAKCIIFPDNKHKRRWDLWIGILLIYTGIFVPLRVAFYDHVGEAFLIFECLVDACFITDIVLTFFTAFQKHSHLEVRHNKIALNYFKSWFFVDLLSSLPFQLLEVAAMNNDADSN